MALTTVNVSVNSALATGQNLANGRVRLMLTGPDVDGTLIVPTAIDNILDNNGFVIIPLWPNARGTQSTQYEASFYDSNGHHVADVYATIPASNCNLHDHIAPVIDQPGMTSLATSTGSSLVGFVQSGTGAVARTVQSELRDHPVSIKNYCVGDGSDETAQFLKAVSASKTVFIPSGMTVAISAAVVTTDLHLIIDKGATLKHHSGSDVRMLYPQAAITISGGGTIDGNRAGQTARPDCIAFAGTSLDVEGILFTGTVQNAINVFSASGDVRVHNCTFQDMAEHGATTGTDTRAVFVGNAPIVSLTNNRVTANTPVTLGCAPAGFQIAVTDGTLYADSCRITGNYFYQIGQAYAGNFGGNIDLYTNAKATIVSNNVMQRPAYIGLKLQTSPDVTCTGNIVTGPYTGDPAAAQPMIKFEQARSHAWDIYGGTVSNNVVDLTGDTTNSCILINGSTTTPIYGTVVSGNACIGGHVGISCSDIGSLSVIGNSVHGATQGFRFVAMDQLGPKVSLVGNQFRSCVYGVLESASGMLNAALSIVGNTFADITSAPISIPCANTDTMKEVHIAENMLVNPPAGANITVNYATLLQVQNNCGQPATPLSYSNITTLVESGNTWDLVPITVSQLPSASASVGQRRIVTDATATTFASTVVGGGANTVPVYSNATNWLIG
jgi:hypothetical protein